MPSLGHLMVTPLDKPKGWDRGECLQKVKLKSLFQN